jgi:hypothetical protein
MGGTTTPEHASSSLVNSMERIIVREDEMDDHCAHRMLSMYELRLVMQKESSDQEYYVKILCQLLDECISYNDSQRVIIHKR